jgi:hypothetical protein
MNMLIRLGEWTSRQLDEASWLRRRTRWMKWIFALAGILALQTSIIHSPDYMINGLYHNRRALNIELQAMPEAARVKLLERLCLARGLFEHGGVDPYQIPGAANCYEAAAKRGN